MMRVCLLPRASVKQLPSTRLSLLVSSLFLSACVSVGPDYQRPQLETPDTLTKPTSIRSPAAVATDWLNWCKRHAFAPPIPIWPGFLLSARR